MKRDPNGPADTDMMGIVHDALRRDLDRLRTAITGRPQPGTARRTALALHCTWLLDFLHTHHTGEDEGLYPMVRRRADAADLAVLDEMTREHERVDPAVAALRSVAERWRVRGEPERPALVAALDDLDAVLRPHLDREEREAMPIVARTVTHGEWHAWDQEHYVQPKGPRELAETGHWLIDGLDPARRRTVLQQVPLIPRYVLLWGFGPGYRRRAAARWTAA